MIKITLMFESKVLRNFFFMINNHFKTDWEKYYLFSLLFLINFLLYLHACNKAQCQS